MSERNKIDVNDQNTNQFVIQDTMAKWHKKPIKSGFYWVYDENTVLSPCMVGISVNSIYFHDTDRYYDLDEFISAEEFWFFGPVTAIYNQ